MSKIKSALELALEKTADLEVNPEKLRLKEVEKEAKRQISALLSGDKGPEDWKSYYEVLDISEAEAARKSAVAVLVSNLTLPRGGLDPTLLPRLTQAFRVVFSDKEEQVVPLVEQCGQILNQYVDHREKVEQNLMDQVEQELRRKEAMLAQQGTPRRLTPQDDPEIMKMVNQQLQGFDEQFIEALKEIKDQLSRLA